MIATELELKPETKVQKSTEGYILEWMQDNPNLCKNTSSGKMTTAMGIAGIPRSQNTLRLTIQKMVKNQMIDKFGSKFRGNYYINYMHSDIPPYILDKMPEGARARREEIKAGLEENQHLDEVGCIVTDTKTEEAPDDVVDLGPEPEPMVIEKKVKDGVTHLTVTLNINLN